MKEFIVGLTFLIAVFLFATVGFLLYPLILVLGMLLRFIIVCAFFVLVIWLLGKLIILLWERFK